jgi:DNA polymerase-3 subunit alpha
MVAPPPLPPLPDFPLPAKLAMERDVTGVYISGHPLDAHRALLEELEVNTAWIEELQHTPEAMLRYDGLPAHMGGIVAEIHTKSTKSGGLMAFLTLEDLTGQIEVLVFPRVYDQYLTTLTVDAMLMLHGKLSVREDEAPKLLLDSAVPLGEAGSGRDAQPQRRPQPQPPSQPATEPEPVLFERAVPTEKLCLKLPAKADLDAITPLLQAMPGGVPVLVRIAESGEGLQVPRELWVTPSPALMSALAGRLGEDCVRLR